MLQPLASTEAPAAAAADMLLPCSDDSPTSGGVCRQEGEATRAGGPCGHYSLPLLLSKKATQNELYPCYSSYPNACLCRLGGREKEGVLRLLQLQYSPPAAMVDSTDARL